MEAELSCGQAPEWNRRVETGETRRDWAARFYEAAATTNRLFRREGGGLTHIGPNGPRILLDPQGFFGVAHTVVEVREERHFGNDVKQVSPLLTPGEVAILFESPEQAQLPTLRSVVHDPVVVPGPTGNRILAPGYDPASRLYYYRAPLTPTIRPLEGVTHLRTCFSAVPFASEGMRNNLMAWLLGAIYYDHLMDSPFLVVDGNQQGVGKTSCVHAAGRIITGGQVQAVSGRGSEFEKYLSTNFLDSSPAARIFFLDNITTQHGRSFDSNTLSTLLTQGPSKRVRILGHSRAVTASGTLFAASLNDAKLSQDLSDRSLPVRLYRDVNCPMAPYCKDYADEHRAELYGELLGLALQAFPATEPGHHQFRFRRWLSFVEPRVEQHFGKLALEAAAALDDVTQEIFGYGADHANVEFGTDEFVSFITTNTQKFPCLSDKLLNIGSDRARKICAGKLLNARINDYFKFSSELTLRLLKVQSGEGDTKARYVFREVQSA
jgi:hypothetical protein